MPHGITVYAADGITEVFNESTRTFKMVTVIPFGQYLRRTTRYVKNPLFLTETPVWFFTQGPIMDGLIDITFTGDTAKIVVDQFWKKRQDGSKYEDPDSPWGAWSIHSILIGVY